MSKEDLEKMLETNPEYVCHLLGNF